MVVQVHRLTYKSLKPMEMYLSNPPTSGEATALLQIATRVSCDPDIDCPNVNDFKYDVIPFEEAISICLERQIVPVQD